jgi:hypothetical protein
MLLMMTFRFRIHPYTGENMLYTEAFNSAISEMNRYYFDEHPDSGFSYFMFEQNLDEPRMLAFLGKLDSYNFYKAPKNKEDHKLNNCPANIKMLWDAVKIACFLISVPDLNYRDLVYHNIDLPLGWIYDLHALYKNVLPMINDNLQSMVLSLHPNGISIDADNQYGFFRKSKSMSSMDVGVSPSFVRRPLTYT